jgi:protein-S-isoprenylcysteine O-methyltransferase Ste14
MNRTASVIGSILWLGVPVAATAVIPWRMCHWKLNSPFFDFAPIRAIGAVLILLGIAEVFESFSRFTIQGQGTPSPLVPPARLVASGAYRRIRNPMYLAIVAIIGGQSLLLGDVGLLIYAVSLWLAFHLFVMIYEEPALRKLFGKNYEDFYAQVPRWLPRLWQRNQS